MSPVLQWALKTRNVELKNIHCNLAMMRKQDDTNEPQETTINQILTEEELEKEDCARILVLGKNLTSIIPSTIITDLGLVATISRL